MSTWLYLECLNHDPPLRSDGEVGQHLYDLPRIREDISNREQFTVDDERGVYSDYGHHFINNAARFLVKHPKCDIGIVDEYGRSWRDGENVTHHG